MGDGLRLAVSLLTVLPVPAGRIDRPTARRAMLLAPLPGLLVGAVAALVYGLAVPAGLGALLAAGLAVAAMAALTRALHLDGLADLADGLGSGKPAGDALAIMKRSDIGPFGVLTLVLTLLIQTAAVAEQHWSGLLIAAPAGRLALAWGCRTALPPARPDGLGALVAGSVRTAQAVAATALAVLAAMAVGALSGGPRGMAASGLAVLLGVAAALLVLRRAVRRLGGVTGDVLGATVEIAATTALVTLALGRP
jgi:adenosylcobinamide-GDP ribazoletransferase